MQTRTGTTLDEAVLDLKTGCIVETMKPFTQITKLAKPESIVTDAATKSEIVRFVTAGRRFGQRKLGFGTFAADSIGFSPDGKTIAVASDGSVFRSKDSGQTFDRLDTMSNYPNVSADGKWIMYERCSDASKKGRVCPDASREVRVVSADGSVSTRTLALGSGLVRGMDPTGQKLLVVRYDMGSEVTVMHVDPSAGTMTRAFGIASTTVKKNRFHDIEPSTKSGAFGVFDDNDNVPSNVMSVFSMTDGKAVQKLTVKNEMGTNVDDESGRIMWQTFPDDHAWARGPKGSIQDLGVGEPLGWAPGGKAVVFASTYAGGKRIEEPAATLGTVACKLVKMTTVP